MTAETLQDQLRHPYVLVVFPRNEDLSGLLKALAVAGQVPLICHTFEDAQDVMKHHHIQAIICEDHLPRTAIDTILKFANVRTTCACVLAGLVAEVRRVFFLRESRLPS